MQLQKFRVPCSLRRSPDIQQLLEVSCACSTTRPAAEGGAPLRLALFMQGRQAATHDTRKQT